MRIALDQFSRNHLIFSASVREEFDGRHYSGELALSSAKNLVSVHLIRNLNTDADGKRCYQRLIKSGYSTDEIIEAIALAWLNGGTHFELRDLDKSLWQNTLFRNIGLPVAASLLVTLTILFSLDKAHSEILIDIFIAPPLVAIFCAVLFFVFYKIFKKR